VIRVVAHRAIAALFVLATVFAHVASAQPAGPDARGAAEEPNASEAKRLFHEGVELLGTQRWPEAEARFRRSVELLPRASSLYNWALSLLALERYGECVEVTDRVLLIAEPVEQAEYRENAAKLRERALAAAAQQQDAALLAPAVPPAPTTAPHTAETTPAQQQPSGVRGPPAVNLTTPDNAEHDRVSPGWFVVGGGALILAGALVTSLLAHSADEDFTERCPSVRDCDPSLMSVGDRAKRLAIATDILLATGAAAVGTGVTIILLDDGAEPRARTAPQVSGVALSLRGQLP